jgi:hypothetical protein
MTFVPWPHSCHQLHDEPFALIRLPPLHAASCAPLQWDAHRGEVKQLHVDARRLLLLEPLQPSQHQQREAQGGSARLLAGCIHDVGEQSLDSAAAVARQNKVARQAHLVG